MRGLNAAPAGKFAAAVLRGVGHVMLQNNPWTGLLFLAGIFVDSWDYGLYALLGTVVATGAAQICGASREDLSAGLFGFNGTLTALALALYLRPNAALPIYVIVAAALSALVMAALRGLPAIRGRELTAPFVLTSWLFLAGVFLFARPPAAPPLGAPHLAVGAPAAATFSPAQTFSAILNGVGQVMFQQNIWTGAIFLLALAVNSRISCAAAALGAAPSAMAQGLYGFNAVLTAIALAGLYFLLRPATVLLAFFAVWVSTIVYAAMAVAFGPLGWPTLAAPCVLTTWLFLASAGPLPACGTWLSPRPARRNRTWPAPGGRRWAGRRAPARAQCGLTPHATPPPGSAAPRGPQARQRRARQLRATAPRRPGRSLGRLG